MDAAYTSYSLLTEGWLPCFGFPRSNTERDLRFISTFSTESSQTLWHIECLFGCLPNPKRWNAFLEDLRQSETLCERRPDKLDWVVCCPQLVAINLSRMTVRERPLHFLCRANTHLHPWKFRQTILFHLPDLMQTIVTDHQTRARQSTHNAQVQPNEYADIRHRDVKLIPGDMVLLSSKTLTFQTRAIGGACLSAIGSFPIDRARPPDTYSLHPALHVPYWIL